MKVYQLPISLYSFKLRLATRLKGLAVDLAAPPDGSYRSSAYRAINPAGTIPFLVDGDFSLAESDAIAEYLDEADGSPVLLAGDARRRARIRMLSRWHDLLVEPQLRRLFAHVSPSQRDSATVADTDARLAERFELVESALDAAGPFALGAQPSLADCGFTATLIWRDRLAPALGLRAAPGQRLARLLAAMESEPRLAAECADYRRLVGAWLASRA